MPVSAMPSIVSGPHGSPVLVAGRFCVPATAAGLTVGTAATGAAVGAVVGVTLEAAVPIGVAVATGAGVNVVIGAGTGVAVPGATVNPGSDGEVDPVRHVDLVMTLVSRVTAPFCARARPSIVAPVFTEIEVSARIVPMKSVPTSIVAELPTCQKMLQDCAPPVRTTLLPTPVMSVETAWKIQTSLGPPESVSGTGPVSDSEEVDLYTPATRFWPPRSALTVPVGGPLDSAWP